MWKLAYWKTLAERAGATFAAVLVTQLGADVFGLDVMAVDWSTALSFAAGGALVMVLMSIGASALPAGGKGVPMLSKPPAPTRKGE